MSQLLLKDGVKPSHVAIIGAGPVGALLALYLARRGWQVDLYDQRAGTFAIITTAQSLKA